VADAEIASTRTPQSSTDDSVIFSSIGPTLLEYEMDKYIS
jgi:hypothetical protein